MITDTLWKLSKGTRELNRILEDEIQAQINVLTDGSLLRSEHLERNYAHHIGLLKSLRATKELLIVENEVEDGN